MVQEAAIESEDRAADPGDRSPEAASAAEAFPDPSNRPSRLKGAGRLAARHPVLVTVLVAALVRLVLAIGIYVVKGGALFGDETTYSGMAAVMVDGEPPWWDAFMDRLYWGTGTFTVPLTLLFKAFGPVTLLGQLLAGAFATVAAGCTAWLAGRVARPALALAAGLVIALMPSQVLFSTLTLKDSAVWGVLAALGVAVVVLNRTAGSRLVAAGAGCAVMLFLLGHLRAHTLVVATWALIGAAIIPSRQRALRLVLVLATTAVVPMAVGVGPFGIDLVLNHGDLATRRANNAENAATAFVADASTLRLQTAAQQVAKAEARLAEVTAKAKAAAASDGSGGAPSAPTPTSDAAAAEERYRAAERTRRLEAERRRELRILEQRRKDLAAARAADARAAAKRNREPLTNLDDAFGTSTTTSSSLRQLPTGLRVMIFDPLPWSSTANPRVQLAKVETILWYPLLAFAVVGILTGRRRAAELAFPVLAVGGIVVMYALSEGNFGTAFRHRGEIVWAVVVVAAAGVETWRRHREDTVTVDRIESA